MMIKAAVFLLSAGTAVALVPQQQHGSRRTAQRVSNDVETPPTAETDWLAAYIVKSHEDRLAAVERVRREVEVAYGPRIGALEAEIAEVRKRGSGSSSGPSPTGFEVSETSSVGRKDFLEFEKLPMNVIGMKTPLAGKIVSVKRCIGESAPGEISHVVLDTGGELPYVEGQSLGVMPPGVSERNGKPHQQRLYSIASTRYGDDGDGKTVSLCVRRAVFVDPETKLEDPEKKGVCSNFLCDAKVGDVVQLTGPTGKAMLLPEDPSADVIMVATGTGIAPFRSFVRRLFLEDTADKDVFSGLAWLFLGVPVSSSLLYTDLWETAQKNKPSNWKYTKAISREESNADGSRVYVQDRIAENAEEIFDRLDKGAHIYFCGLKGMMGGIQTALEDSATKKGIDWPTFLKKLKKNKQWHVEVY